MLNCTRTWLVVSFVFRVVLRAVWLGSTLLFGLRLQTLGNGREGNLKLRVQKIGLHGKSLDLHLGGDPATQNAKIMVLYGSGDGGWFGPAVHMFKDIVRLGYPAAGFSTRAYLKAVSNSGAPVSLDEVADDYESIVQAAHQALDLPQEMPTVLTGWSRGAAFAVLVAAQKRPDLRLAGVVAIGLPDKEELKLRIHHRKILVANFPSGRQHIIFDTYDRISAVAPLPLSLIQATHDDYLPAQAARVLFGPDSVSDRFFPVEANDHKFGGGQPAFVASLRESLAWICKQIP